MESSISLAEDSMLGPEIFTEGKSENYQVERRVFDPDHWNDRIPGFLLARPAPSYHRTGHKVLLPRT